MPKLAPAVAPINFSGTESSYELLGIFELSNLQGLTLTDLDPEMILVKKGVAADTVETTRKMKEWRHKVAKQQL